MLKITIDTDMCISSMVFAHKKKKERKKQRNYLIRENNVFIYVSVDCRNNLEDQRKE